MQGCGVSASRSLSCWANWNKPWTGHGTTRQGLLEEHLVDSAQVAAAACDATHAANDAVLAAASVVQAAIEVRTAFILVIVQSIDVGSREQSIDVGSRDAAAAVAEQYAGS